MDNRAIRRHHIARLKNNRKSYWGYDRRRDGQMDAKQLGKVVQYPTPCSCTMCGNPRKKIRGKKCLTIQEQKQRSCMAYELEELLT